MTRFTPLLLATACALAACTDSKTPKAPPAVPTPKADARDLHGLFPATAAADDAGMSAA